MIESPWLRIALEEMKKGVKEVEGLEDNPRIIEYHSATSGNFQHDEVPWCSSFVNWCMDQALVSRTNSALSRSWLGWGKRISHPPTGAVTILSRGVGPQPGPHVIKAPGHVGFFMGNANSTDILLLGGNQGNTISVRSYPTSKVLGFRWPGE